MIGRLVQDQQIRLALQHRLYGSPFYLTSGTSVTTMEINLLRQIADSKTRTQNNLTFVRSIHSGQNVQ